MYQNFFGLNKLPFENVNDINFFFESENHKEAYSRMAFAIESKKSCAVLTGGYGTGKTFILKTLEKKLYKSGYLFSFINNPALDSTGLLRMMLYNFTSHNIPKNKDDVLIGLEKFMRETYRDGKHTVIVIDEAQNIENEKVIEELRMLLNYESETRPLLTLILSGQPEFSERIRSNKQFSQRIFLSYPLKPLTLSETIAYINHRFKIAGGKEELFNEEVCRIIFERSGGIPRWINNISNMILLNAFSKNSKNIDIDMVNEAIETIKE